MANTTMMGHDRPESAGGAGTAVYAAAGLFLLAALIHLWAAPEHMEEWWGYGAFFLTAATAQGLFAVLLLRWPRKPLLLLSGIWSNLAIVGMYVVTRTYGVPLGPHAGVSEDAGLLDMMATAAEVALVVVLTAMLGGAYRRVTVNALFVVGAAVWALRLTGILP